MPAMKLPCPLTGCGRENPGPVSNCAACGADLRAYALALKWPDYCFNAALDLLRDGRFREAQRELEACLKLRARDDEAALLLGKTYWARGEKRNARGVWKGLLTGSSDSIREQAAACLAAAAPPRKTTARRTRKAKRGAEKTGRQGGR